MRDIMSKIAILTDSSCDIPQELAEKYVIDIMSFHILLDDVDYIERESCTKMCIRDSPGGGLCPRPQERRDRSRQAGRVRWLSLIHI